MVTDFARFLTIFPTHVQLSGNSNPNVWSLDNFLGFVPKTTKILCGVVMVMQGRVC
jgi:hypothetical protein